MLKLSNAQQELLDKLKEGNKLIQINNTWIKENVFLQDANGTYKRTNLKVVRKLLEFNLINLKPVLHPLVKEYELNVEV